MDHATILFRSEPAPAPAAAAGWTAGPALALAAALLAAACSSGEGSKQKDAPFQIDELEVTAIRSGEVTIGEFLAKIDLSLRAWTRLTNTAATPAERRQARQLEDFIRNETGNRQAELVTQLETGPLYNRMRAASALGFTDSSALSPLLAALADREPDVVHNALLGLALLADPATPLGDVCELMSAGTDGHLRSNAAYALRSVVAAGGEGSCAVPAARRGLLDPEPLVRVQAALILGLSSDVESLPALTDQIYDETPLVARAAIEALSLIAGHDPAQRGPVARALLTASEKAPRTTRPHAKLALIQLAGLDYGDYQDWLRWASGLP